MRFSKLALLALGAFGSATAAPGDEGTVCYQTIVGSSTGSYADIEAAFGDWAQKAYVALGLTGPRDVSINWAQVPDRNSFENGCDGPFNTVADLFVHIDTNALSDDYDGMSAKLEAFIAANPITNYGAISCGARSVTEFIPICGINPSTPTAPNPPQPTDEGTVCFQEIVGSLTGSYADVQAAFDDWANRAYAALGLTGFRGLHINYAQVPDRNSFENGCDGPYNTVADIFVHIDTNAIASEDYASLKAKLEVFIAANPFTNYPAISCSARSITDEIPVCGINKGFPTPGPSTPTGPNPPLPADEGTVCYQTIVGSLAGSYADIEAAFGDWAQKAYVALGLTGPRDVSINWAQVPDRNSFENGCDGPYNTVADLFVHIDTNSLAGEDYASMVAKLEAFIAANPITNYAAISCGARSVTEFIPICGLNPTTPTAPNVPQPTDEGTVCFQEIVGSLTGSYADVQAAFDDWANRAYAALGLTGFRGLHINYAQVPDRNSFENGCDGPYTTVADIFVHIDTNAIASEDYASLKAKLETFIAANPFTAYPAISCSARSITDEIPVCGINKGFPTSAPSTPTGPNTPLPADEGTVCYQTIVGSLTGSYADIEAAFGDWAQKAYIALGLTGPRDVSINWAQVPDRVSFENGCDGPFNTVADLFVHINTNNLPDDYASMVAKLEAFIAANPITNYPAISCGARSVTEFIPICGLNPSTPTAPNPTQAPADEGTVCYQEIVGSLTGSYADVSAAFDDWANRAYAALGLTGARGLHINYAQVPDRNSFENGCDGPYNTVADFFVHIDSNSLPSEGYASLKAKLETFIAANPFTAYPAISCSARSITDNIPVCGINKGFPSSGSTPSTPSGQQCPNVAFTPSVSMSGTTATITYTVNTPVTATITFVDVHVTTSMGFFNYRMSAAASSTPAAPVYELVLPAYLAMGPGVSMSYWFTTASTSAAYPTEFACDSASYSYTTAGTPSGPAATAAPTATCPTIAFDHAIERTGAGSVAGSSLYTITFAAATPAATVDWVDVHISANGGQFNYRADTTATGFAVALPSPHLDIMAGSSVSYSFTYQSGGIACDTASYTVAL